MAAGSMNSALTSGLRKAKQLAREERRQAVRQTVRSTAAAYSSAPEKRRQEAGPITAAKQENTPARTQSGGHKEAYLSLPTGQKAAYARELLSHYRSGDLEKQAGKMKAASGRGSTLHISASGNRYGGSHGSLGGLSVYEQRRQQRDAARKDFWNHTLDLLGTASAQAGRGIAGISVPVEQQIEESRRQIENVRAIREANARFEATRQPIEWDGRAELISALEQLDMQSGWEINEEQANAAEQQRQELLARLRGGDLAAGNGVRSGTDADTGRDVVEGSAKGIAGACVNLVSNLGQLMAKADAYSYSENEFLTDWMLGNDPSVMRQARIDAYESAEAKEYWSSIDAIADRLDNDAAAVLRRAKEGKSIVGEMGVDVAKGVLEMGFDAGLAAVTGGSALVPLAARVYGQSVGTARRAGATLEQQAAYGLTSATIEVASEMLFDGVAKIYGAGAADDIVEKLVVELAESDTGRSMLRFLAGAAGEGAGEVVSDLLSPLAEATYRDESLAELYRQLEPSELLYDYLIGAAISTLASGASAATRQSGEASAEYRANEAEYFNILELNGHLESKNAAPDGTAEDSEQNVESRSLSQHKISGLSGLDAAEDEGSSSALHTYHDPIREKIGSAFQSHPKAMSKILKTLEHRGIEVEYRPGSMSYSPNSESGKPGKLIMDPDASYSAWLHELQHLADDEASGWQGMHILAADQMRALEFEERAYRLEIDFAKKNGYSKIAKRLERLLFERRQEILGTQRNNKQSQA